MTLDELLKLAYEVQDSFEKEIVPELTLYMDGPRGKELLEMIDEIKKGDLKDHSSFDNYWRMDTEELYFFKKSLNKACEFKKAFMLKKSELESKKQ
jgi:hypothetical protein